MILNNKISRRSFLAGMGGALFANQVSAFDDPDLITPTIRNVSSKFSNYAFLGKYGNNIKTFKFSSGADIFFFVVPEKMTSGRLVVFSHDAIADPIKYRPLLEHWASRGFFVVAPLHNDALIQDGPTFRKSEGKSSLQSSGWQVSQLLQDPVEWQKRVELCTSAILAFDDWCLTSGRKFVKDRVIISGHGYGAYIAQLLMGTEVIDNTNRALSFRDDRFFAGLCLSPQGTDIMGLSDNSWRKVTSPMMFAIPGQEADFTGQSIEQKRSSFDRCPKGYKHLAIFPNASSLIYTSDSNRSVYDSIPDYLAMRAMTAAFLESYGDYNKEAFSDLSSGFFGRIARGIVEERVK